MIDFKSMSTHLGEGIAFIVCSYLHFLCSCFLRDWGWLRGEGAHDLFEYKQFTKRSI